MTNEWVLDVLADIKSFAIANDLPGLAGQLDEARIVAAAELASQTGEVAANDYVNARRAGQDTGAAKLVSRA